MVRHFLVWSQASQARAGLCLAKLGYGQGTYISSDTSRCSEEFLSRVWASRPLGGCSAFTVTELLCSFEPISLLLGAQCLQDQLPSNTAGKVTASHVCCDVTEGWRGPVGHGLALLSCHSSALFWKTSAQRSREPDASDSAQGTCVSTSLWVPISPGPC